MLIGIAGKAGSGKTTVAKYLESKYNFRRVSFATPLKVDVARLLVETYGVGDWNLSILVDEFLSTNNPEKRRQLSAKFVEWVDDTASGAKWNRKAVLRTLLQGLGMALRELKGEDYWIARTFADIKSDEDVVIDDVRFLNEAKTIEHRGGHVFKTDLPWNIRKQRLNLSDGQFEQMNSHVSEQELDKIVAPMVDTSGVFANQVDELIKRFKGQYKPMPKIERMPNVDRYVVTVLP